MSDERRVRGGIYGVRSSEIYEGAMLLRAFQVRRAVLYCILSRMGNQWSSLRTGVMWSNLRVFVKTRAAEFWTIWSLWICCSEIPFNSAFPLSSTSSYIAQHEKTKDPCPGGKITKSAETNDIFPLKWYNHKYFHNFKNFISQSGSEVTPLLKGILTSHSGTVVYVTFVIWFRRNLNCVLKPAPEQLCIYTWVFVCKWTLGFYCTEWIGKQVV